MFRARPSLARGISSLKYPPLSGQFRSFSIKAMSGSSDFPAGPIHWVLDWDGTLTKRDTLDALVDIAARRKPDSTVPEEWKRVTKAYLSDYEHTLQAHTPNGKLPTTISGEKALLEILEQVEQRSVDRVSVSGIFKDLTKVDVEKGATDVIESGKVQLREGCSDFLVHIQSHCTPQDNGSDAIHILSVNWSQMFIASCLRASHVDHGHPILNSINSNELEGLKQDRPTTGRICVPEETRIISSRDKLECLDQLRRSNLRNGKPIPVVYIGDSWTDFECLLAADLGICMRDDPMTSSQKKLAEALVRVGVRCVHIHERKQGVVWVRNFREIKEWISRT